MHALSPITSERWLLDLLPATGNGRMQVLGISGLQGCGKSTLAAQLVQYAQHQGMRAASLSLDDLYLGTAQRRQLADQVHPLLATRGPPGSHDLALGHAVLDALQAGGPCALPRFDKLADEPLPKACWPVAGPHLDLLVLEGWMLGVPAQDAAALVEPVNALEREQDSDGRWRGWCNAVLGRDYPPLWRRIDHLCHLQAPGWEVVEGWRRQQEQQLKLESGDKAAGMDDRQLRRFIAHFERISRHALACLPALAHSQITVDEQRRVRARHTRPRLTAPRTSLSG